MFIGQSFNRTLVRWPGAWAFSCGNKNGGLGFCGAKIFRWPFGSWAPSWCFRDGWYEMLVVSFCWTFLVSDTRHCQWYTSTHTYNHIPTTCMTFDHGFFRSPLQNLERLPLNATGGTSFLASSSPPRPCMIFLSAMRATRIRGEVIFRSNEVWFMWRNPTKTRSEPSTKNPCGWIVTGPRTLAYLLKINGWKIGRWKFPSLKWFLSLGTFVHFCLLSTLPQKLDSQFPERLGAGGPFFAPHELIGGLKVAAWEAPPNHLHENTLEGHGARNQQTFLECTCEGAGSWGAEETGGGGGFGKQWGGGIGA